MQESQPQTPGCRALLIGIDDYRQPGLRPLRGCVNDARLMADLLIKQFGFARENVRLLLNQEASRSGIQAALEQLSVETQPADIVVLYYAGHGSRMPDREGTKPTGWDETLVCADSGRAPAPNRDITDDELRLWLLQIETKAPYVTLIFDCCHSGTMLRGEQGEGDRSAPEETRPASDLPPSPVRAAHRALLSQADTQIDILPQGDRYTILSACRDEEKAQEYTTGGAQNASVHGAFTYFLAQALADPAAAGQVRTYREVFERLALRVMEKFPRQHPRCEGTLDRALFSRRLLPRQRAIEVVARDGEEVTMYAGAVHGITAGSLWQLVERDPGGAAVEVRKLGRARVHSVSAGIARARLLEGGAAMQLPCRALELGESDSSARWPIACAVPELQALLADSPWVRAAALSETARLHARQLRRSTGPRWLVTDAAGTSYGAALADQNDRDTLLAVRERLELIVRAERVRELGNPQSPLSQSVELVLLRGTRGTMNWEPVFPDAQGRSLFREGEHIAMEIRNRSAEPIYAAALVVAVDHSITQLYPPIGAAAQLIAPRRVLRVGAWRLSLATKAASAPDETPLERGLDTLKLLVTRTEVNYQPLLATGVRGAPAANLNHPLALQLGRLAAGILTRGAVEPSADEDWSSIDTSVLIERTSSPYK